MLFAILFLADLQEKAVAPVTRTEFERQAAICGANLQYELRGEAGYAARLDKDQRRLFLRTNQKPSARDCLERWGEAKGLTVILWSN